MLRKVRVAFSIVCGIVCLLLIVLWVRSYEIQWPKATLPGDFWYSHRLPQPEPGPRIYVAESRKGSIQLSTASWDNGWSVVAEYRKNSILGLGFDVRKGPTSLWVGIPHWFPILMTAVFSIAPWIHLSRRFSLHTLLIAMTLVAVLLGAIIHAIR
jgi:hypothetical protein